MRLLTIRFNKGAACFNQYIYPITGVRFRTVVWYQGEGQPVNFEKNLTNLIGSWRESFGYTLPFILVGLPTYGGDDQLPEDTDSFDETMPSYSGAWFSIREGQKSVCEKMEKCYSTVSVGLGDYDEIHPYDKSEIGSRTAAVFAEKIYGYVQKEKIIPRAVKAEVVGEEIKIAFDRVANGLLIKNGSINLELSTDGENFVGAVGRIEGECLWISVEEVQSIKFVRYGYNNYPRITRNEVGKYFSLYTQDGYAVDQFLLKIQILLKIMKERKNAEVKKNYKFSVGGVNVFVILLRLFYGRRKLY